MIIKLFDNLFEFNILNVYMKDIVERGLQLSCFSGISKAPNHYALDL